MLLVAVVGCESLQKKFVRKSSKTDKVTPIIQFKDYTNGMTPLDRYRKHSILFDYWNTELLETLQSRSFNAKRAKKASADSLAELYELRALLSEEPAGKLAPLITEREHINAEVQSGRSMQMQAQSVVRRIEAQTRALHRDFYWRDVQDRLVEQAAP